jgi:hypothetical protein
MIDGFKSVIEGVELIELDAINSLWTQVYDIGTGEIMRPLRSSTHEGLYLRYSEVTKKLYINGSMHKLYNHLTNPNSWEIGNGGRFTMSQIKETVSYLSETFNTPPERWKIVKLEYGHNLEPPIEIDTILNGTNGKRNTTV